MYQKGYFCLFDANNTDMYSSSVFVICKRYGEPYFIPSNPFTYPTCTSNTNRDRSEIHQHIKTIILNTASYIYFFKNAYFIIFQNLIFFILYLIFLQFFCNLIKPRKPNILTIFLYPRWWSENRLDTNCLASWQ